MLITVFPFICVIIHYIEEHSHYVTVHLYNFRTMCFSRNLHSRNNAQQNGIIKILTWNVEGYMTKNTAENCCNKLNISTVNRMLKKHDIICLNETWTNSDSEKSIQLSDYEPFRSSREKRNKRANRDSGGVAILVRKNILKYVSRQPNLYEDAIWLKIDENLFGLNETSAVPVAIWVTTCLSCSVS